MIFPPIEMAQPEYDALPDYSVAYPKKIEVGAMWKTPRLCWPGEKLVYLMASENIVQVYSCNIVETKLAQGISGRETIDLIWDNFESAIGDDRQRTL